jgi:uncharacterized protein (TIGR00369 family)
VLTAPSDQTHLLQELGFDHWVADGFSYGRTQVLPGMLVPGTELVRIGALVILADMAAGQPPSGAVTPTTDLNVHVARLRPMRTINVAARVLKAGATLMVVRTTLAADDDPEPFAVSLATFMNRSVPIGTHLAPSDVRLSQPLDVRIGAQVVRPGLVELVPDADIDNGHHGTVQGGVLATLAELAAESLLAEQGPCVVTDLDIRFLSRVKVGPVRAVAEPVVDGRSGRVVDVTIADAGDGDRVVAHVRTSSSLLADVC